MISVVIPTFKRPERLYKAVDSVLAQTYVNFEVIVVDDDVEGAVMEFGDKRVKYGKNERRKGGNGARNTGIIRSTGDYIAFLDDDDEWVPTKLEEQIKKVELLDDAWAGCFCGWTTDQKEYLVNVVEVSLYTFLRDKFSIGASSTLLIRRSVFEVIGLWDEELIRHQDHDLLIRILMRFKLAFVNKSLVIVNGHNVPSYDRSKKAKALFIDKLNSIKAFLPSEDYNYFIALQYKDLAVFASLEGRITESFRNINAAYQFAFIPFYRFFSVFVYLLNYYTIKAKFGKFKANMK